MTLLSSQSLSDFTSTVQKHADNVFTATRGKSTSLPFTCIWPAVKDQTGWVHTVLPPHSSDFTVGSKAICDQRFMSKDYLAENPGFWRQGVKVPVYNGNR